MFGQIILAHAQKVQFRLKFIDILEKRYNYIFISNFQTSIERNIEPHI